MVGVAILGAGDIANVHIEAYNELAGRCRIVALADIYTDKAEAKKQKYGLDCDVVARDLGKGGRRMHLHPCGPSH